MCNSKAQHGRTWSSRSHVTHGTWHGQKATGVSNHSDWHVYKKIFSLCAPYRYTEQRLNLDELVYAFGEFTAVGSD